jgi:basic membrane lipoprotein Med (substrate-binding protein (PBP1-ABC) superfamily)
MQKASADTRVRVSYLQVMGPQTVDNTLPHLNSLLLRQCQVVLAVGSAQVGAVETQVKRYPKVRFVVVDGEAEAAANITMFRSGDGLSDMVAESIKDAFGNAK